ncbi:hypothetical protein PIB30_105474, partial [Stylosanthes scabra]|nr:hypothetical protein [Stylosanthes scabra]
MKHSKQTTARNHVEHAASRTATESRQARRWLRFALDYIIEVERTRMICTDKWRERRLHSRLPPAK